MDIEDGWDESVLTKLTPFTVDFEATQIVVKTTKDGGKYEKKKIVVASPAYANLFAVEVTKKSYNALRLLNLSGVRKFTASEGTADTRGFRPIFYAGAKGLDSVA